MPNSELPLASLDESRLPSFVIRISDFFGHSSFVIRNFPCSSFKRTGLLRRLWRRRVGLFDSGNQVRAGGGRIAPLALDEVHGIFNAQPNEPIALVEPGYRVALHIFTVHLGQGSR